MTEQTGEGIGKRKWGLKKLMGQKEEGVKMSNSFLAFTFFYAIGIYILLISFYFWQIRTDIKPEK